MRTLIKDYSLQEFIDEFGHWGDGLTDNCIIKIINREKHKVVFSESFKAYDRPPSYIITRLLDGMSEEAAIPKKTIASIGEIIKHNRGHLT